MLRRWLDNDLLNRFKNDIYIFSRYTQGTLEIVNLKNAIMPKIVTQNCDLFKYV